MKDQVIAIAQTQIGNSETPKGSNWGIAVSQYLKSVGILRPAPWCMAFVYWCVDKAYREAKKINPLKKTAGVMDQKINSKLPIVSVPMPGDIFIMSFGSGKGHAGLVEKIIDQDTIQTIEGNSNDEGSREGYEVIRRIRKIKTINSFLRYES